MQKATNDLDRDETYIPPLRSALPFAVAGAHALEETPAATLLKLCIRQFLCVVSFCARLLIYIYGSAEHGVWAVDSNFTCCACFFFAECVKLNLIISN